MITSIAKATPSAGRRVSYLGNPNKSAVFVASNIPGADRDPRLAVAELDQVASLRPSVSNPSAHFSLRPKDGEILDTATWSQIAELSVERLGFSNGPWVAVTHNDTGTPHLHVVASYVDYQGNRVSNSWDRHVGMRLAREIEQRFELSAPTPRNPEKRQLQRSEFHGTDAELAPRRIVQSAIDQARADRPDYAEFVDRLAKQGIEARLTRTDTGRVLGISYEREGHRFRGSDLGKPYSWPQVQASVTYAAERHEPVVAPRELTPAREQPRGTSFQPLSATEHQTLVRGQLAALPAERYSVLILNRETGERISRPNLTGDEVLKSLAFYRAQNANGAEILFRPERPHFIPLSLSPSQLLSASQLGLSPAAVVETSRATAEAWFRPPQPLEPQHHKALAAELREALGAPADRLSNYGHLAGFRTRSGDRAELADASRAALPSELVERTRPRAEPAAEPLRATVAAALHDQGIPWPSALRPDQAAAHRAAEVAFTKSPSQETYQALRAQDLRALLANPGAALPLRPDAPFRSQDLEAALQSHARLIRLHHERIELLQHPRGAVSDRAIHHLDHAIRERTTVTAAAYQAANLPPLLPLPAPPRTLRELAAQPAPNLAELTRAARAELATTRERIPPPLRADRLRALAPETLTRRADNAHRSAERALVAYRRGEPDALPRLAAAATRANAYHAELGRRAQIPHLSRAADPRPPARHAAPYYHAHTRTEVLKPSSATPSTHALARAVAPARLTLAAIRPDRPLALRASQLLETGIRFGLTAIGLPGAVAGAAATATLIFLRAAHSALRDDRRDPRDQTTPQR